MLSSTENTGVLMMKFLASFILVLLGLPVQAQEINQMYRPIRSMGMGGTMLTTVHGSEALFSNPAAMGKIEGLDIHLLSVGLGGRTPTKEDLDAIEDIDGDDPSTYNGLFGRRLHFLGTGSAAIALPYIGFGYYTDYTLSLELHNPGYPEFTTYFRNDSAYYVGGAYPLGPKTFLGLALKRVNRWGGDVQELGLTTVANASDINAIMDQFENKGTGYGVDLAILTQADTPLNPTLTVVWKDVGSTAFEKTAGAEAPSHIPQNLGAGVSLGFDLPGLDWIVALEGQHLLDPDIQIGKKLHLGTEISIPFLDIRAGINQGYFSYGAGFDFFIFRLDAASYTEELGVYPGQSADNRIMVGLSIDLSFDANFKFTDNSGKKRKLKQRR
ncbi:hypothetical protein Bdt_3071 [Bdellovibrio bacteriovorus str. Tiberius]|uniref:PorV/PorQ family protein n=2 Tax=Bdellovibrio bacteriovorus TaxID=959 RepID=K7YS64_BDEBC|nr:hypothetical protein Bdt_3071 [Bdellovibrio bacteriovorus str. Tiberius]